MRRLLFVAPVVLACMAGVGCSGDSSKSDNAATTTSAELGSSKAAELAKVAAAPRPSFVGKVEGTNAYVAFVEEADGVIAYFCDGDKLGLWFRGEAGSTTLDATHPSGAALSARRATDGFTGSVTIAGTAHSFTTSSATHPAGLWEGFDLAGQSGATENARFGWIVLPDGTQRGAKVSKTGTTSVGPVSTGTGGSGNTTANPSPPNPQPTSLSDEGCAAMKRVFDYSVTQLNATNDMWYDRAARVAVNAYDNGGCASRFGSIVN